MREPKTLPSRIWGEMAGEPPPAPVYKTTLPEVIRCCEAVIDQINDLEEDGMPEHVQHAFLTQIRNPMESVRNVARWYNKHHDALYCRLTTAFRAIRELQRRGPLFDYQREALAEIEAELRRGFAADLHLVKFGVTENETVPDIFF